MTRAKVFATLAVVCSFALTPTARMQTVSEAPAGFDGLTNGHTDQATFDLNQEIFEDVETIADGVGPTFNSNSCAACHSHPAIGGISQITEERAGHFNGTNFIDHPGGSLIESLALDPSIQEHVLDGNEVRTFRTSLNLLGDGFVEAIANDTLIAIRNAQPVALRGTLITVPVVEAGGIGRIGRFGWKNQQASLMSFAGDAYLNEMGITNCVADDCTTFGSENSSNGDSVAAFDAVPDPEDEGEDVLAFAEFMRATKVPPRGPITAAVAAGSALFDQAQCNVCHVRNITTAAPGTLINGGFIPVSYTHLTLPTKRIV